MSKKLIVYAICGILLIFLLLNIIHGKTIPKKQVKEDIVSNCLTDEDGNILVDQVDQIKGLNYLMNKSFNDKDNLLFLPIRVQYKTEYTKGTAIYNLIYKKEKNSWQLRQYDLVTADYQLTQGIDSLALSAAITEQYGYDIDGVVIDNSQIDQENNTVDVDATIVYYDGPLQCTKKLEINLVYYNHNANQSKWWIQNVDVKEEHEKLVSGVSEQQIRQSLYNLNFGQWFDDNNISIRINSDDEISALKVVSQDTQLDKFEDHVKLDLTLQKENAKIQGSLSIDYKFDNNYYGWTITDVKFDPIQQDSVTILEPLTLTKDDIKSILVGKSFYYYGYSRWMIQENEIQSLDVINQTYNFIGNQTEIDVQVELSGSEELIEGVIAVYFSYYGDGWTLDNIQAPSSFSRTGFKDYKNQLTELNVRSVSASSTRDPMGKYHYDASNVIDHNTKTAWVEGQEDEGVGEWVELKLAQKEKVSLIEMYLGYQQDYSTYYKNHRPKVLKIEYGTGQSVNFDADDSTTAQYLYFKEPIETDYLKFYIEDFYPGNNDKDTSISEINVFGS